jgi:hypothetical protein
LIENTDGRERKGTKTNMRMFRGDAAWFAFDFARRAWVPACLRSAGVALDREAAVNPEIAVYLT